MNVCPGEGVAYDSYYNETDRVIYPKPILTLLNSQGGKKTDRYPPGNKAAPNIQKH